jgi:MFS superfamily sulfate permease-like transporter
VKDAPSAVRWMVVDAGAIASVDYTAAWIVRKLHQELSSRGTELVFAHVQSDLTPDLERHHLAGAPGQIRIFSTLHEMLAGLEKHEETL